MKPVLTALLASLALGACASSPDMHRASGPRDTGYSEHVIDVNRYRVDYRMEGRDTNLAYDFALLRAAELTLEKGYTTFEIVSGDTDSETRERPVSSFGVERDVAVTRSCGLLGCTTRATPVYRRSPFFGSSETERAKTVSLEILMTNASADGRANSYDAASVAKHTRENL